MSLESVWVTDLVLSKNGIRCMYIYIYIIYIYIIYIYAYIYIYIYIHTHIDIHTYSIQPKSQWSWGNYVPGVLVHCSQAVNLRPGNTSVLDLLSLLRWQRVCPLCWGRQVADAFCAVHFRRQKWGTFLILWSNTWHAIPKFEATHI